MPKNIYLYGVSDDCMECETDFGANAESYYGIKLNHVIVHYVYDGDWGIWLENSVPETWKVRSIRGNMPSEVRGKPHAGQFLHIQIPDDEAVNIIELQESQE